MDNTETNWIEEVGAPAYASIVEMVAALECDYDRLDELAENELAYKRCIESYQEKMTDWQANADATDALEELAELRAAATSREEAEQRIQEDALSVEVRADWHAVGDAPDVANGQFVILLSTGGPASRIRGELSNGEPYRAWLEVQDWGKPWTQYFKADREPLLTYARCFYFGEG